jgi:hypothetical protein
VRGLYVLLILGLLGALFPRQYFYAQLDLDCDDCGAVTRYCRRQGLSPDYVPLKYSWAAYEWVHNEQRQVASPPPNCPHAHRKVSISFGIERLTWHGFQGGVSAFGASHEVPGKPVQVNGLDVNPQTVWPILRATTIEPGFSIGGGENFGQPGSG